MLTDLLLVIASLVMLYFGASWLVSGASSVAVRLGITPLVVGLTVVAYGTSMPELIVSIQAALEGSGSISIGNVVGSNIFNIAIILGLSALFYPLKVQTQVLRYDVPIMLAAALLFLVFFLDNHISRLEGLVFTGGVLMYTLFNIRKSRHEKQPAVLEEFQEALPPARKRWIDLLLIVLGLATLIWGSDLLVGGAVSLARRFGVSDAIIGLTIVAAGTSMPELATSVVAAIKKQSDIALGNVVGSNIYNILAILGISAVITPIEAPDIALIDSLVMVGISLLLVPLVRTGFVLQRWEGGVLLLVYAVYLYYLWPA